MIADSPYPGARRQWIEEAAGHDVARTSPCTPREIRWLDRPWPSPVIDAASEPDHDSE